MRRPDQRHETRSTTSTTAWLPVVAALAIMATGCLSTFFVLQMDQFRPKVGDIIAFRPNSQDGEPWEMTVPAKVVGSDPAARTCSLDPNVMAADGGSMIVEMRQETPSLNYRVHWSGKHTDKTQDCGPRANLLVSRVDLQRLANTAGGFGVGDKGITR